MVWRYYAGAQARHCSLKIGMANYRPNGKADIAAYRLAPMLEPCSRRIPYSQGRMTAAQSTAPTFDRHDYADGLHPRGYLNVQDLK